MARGVFVTGTDTGVGKTVVSACLVRRWNADYWKPAQTGLAAEPGDSETVSALTGLPRDRVHRPRHELAAPRSVEAAAALQGARVELDDFTLPATQHPLVVEGAGGVLVPLNDRALMVDLMARLGLPVLLVARTVLGTINHSLLSLEALRARGLHVAGVVFVGTAEPDTASAIARHGQVPVIGTLPWMTSVSPEALADAASLLPAWEQFVLF
jgi:malonyl-CoA O-methyltransferase